MQHTVLPVTPFLALASSPALATNPYAKADDSWVSISGTFADPSADPRADQFTLDYGDGIITVEIDDWDNDRDAYRLMDGDKVTVYGEVDMTSTRLPLSRQTVSMLKTSTSISTPTALMKKAPCFGPLPHLWY